MTLSTTARRGLVSGAVISLAGALLTGCEVGDSGSSADTSGEYPQAAVTILAPGSTGGGWDTRARAIQSGLGACEITEETVNVENIPGAGGTIGLADFVTKEGDPQELMVMDTVTMLGGIIRNESPYDLEELTPIAALTVAKSAIVVPDGSPIESMDDLRAAMQGDPRGVAWAGGSLGGPDHIMASLLAKEDGIDIKDVNYVATGGGSEVISLLTSGSADVAVSTVTEIRSQIEAGEFRALAVSGDEPIEGVDAPTLADLDLTQIDTSSTGAVLAPPGVSEEEAAQITAMFSELHGTTCWQEALEANTWADAFADGASLERTIAEDKAKVEEILSALDLGPDE